MVDAHDRAGDAPAVATIDRDGVAALALTRLRRRGDRFRRCLLQRLICATFVVGVALRRHAGDLSGSLGAFLRKRGLKTLLPVGDQMSPIA